MDDPRQKDKSQRETVTVEYRHPLATCWMHWINFPLLFLMIYSGILIYWADSQYEGLFAHRVYRIGIGNWTLFRLFPTWFYDTFHLKFQLARGLAYHSFFMWFFSVNGLAYITYNFISGEWRDLVPNRESLRGSVAVVLHELGLDRPAGAKVQPSAADYLHSSSADGRRFAHHCTGDLQA